MTGRITRGIAAAGLAFVLAGCNLVTADIERPGTGRAVQIPAPQQLEIPSLQVSSSLIPVGLTDDGEQEVPDLATPGQAAWFNRGPEPGENGAAVIVGHIDGRGIPGVFYELDQLKVGDAVKVDQRTFMVYEVDRVPKTEFPADRVYGSTNGPELRLITCGGEFDHASGNYDDNIIVYARIVTE